MTEESKNSKEAVSQILKEIDKLDTKEKYMHFCNQAIGSVMESIIEGKVPLDTLAIVRMLTAQAMFEDTSWKQASRKAADSLHIMFKGVFEMEERIASGEDLTAKDVMDMAYKSAKESAHGKG